MRNNDIWVDRASKIICTAAVIGGSYLLFEYATLPMMTLIIAFLVSELTHPLASRIARSTKLPIRAVAGALVVLLFVLLVVALSILCGRLYAECKGFISWLSHNGGKLSVIISYYVSFMEKLPFGLYLEEMSKMMIKNLITFLGAGIGRAIGTVVGSSAQIVTWIVFLVAACVYVTVDRERIYGLAESFVPQVKRKKFVELRRKIVDIAKSYAKAYVLIFILTFLETFAGLCVLRSPYALLMSVIVAAVDILPVLGSGAVLVPWAVISFLSGEGGSGIGLLILFGVITIVRQIVEPKIIGNGVGIHPLAVISAICFGTWLFGAKGVLVAPVCLVIIKAVFAGKTKKM